MNFFQFRQNSTIYMESDISHTHPMPNLTHFSHVLAEDPGTSTSSVVAILPDFDRFLRIWSKLNYLYRFNCQQAPIMLVLTFVSQLLAEDPGPSIPSVVAILPDFDGLLQLSSKLDYLYRFSHNPTPAITVIRHLKCQN